MTPPEHFVVGLTTTNAVFAGASLRNRFRGSYLLCLVLGSSMSVFPDIDSFFGSYTSSNPFIGHRGWTHSFLAILLASLIAVSAYSLFVRATRAAVTRSYYLVLSFSMILAGFSHLACDLITPPSVWGGLPLLFPLFIRFGGCPASAGISSHFSGFCSCFCSRR